jgi:hypothetical protein
MIGLRFHDGFSYGVNGVRMRGRGFHIPVRSDICVMPHHGEGHQRGGDPGQTCGPAKDRQPPTSGDYGMAFFKQFAAKRIRYFSRFVLLAQELDGIYIR